MRKILEMELTEESVKSNYKEKEGVLYINPRAKGLKVKISPEKYRELVTNGEKINLGVSLINKLSEEGSVFTLPNQISKGYRGHIVILDARGTGTLDLVSEEMSKESWEYTTGEDCIIRTDELKIDGEEIKIKEKDTYICRSEEADIIVTRREELDGKLEEKEEIELKKYYKRLRAVPKGVLRGEGEVRYLVESDVDYYSTILIESGGKVYSLTRLKCHV